MQRRPISKGHILIAVNWLDCAAYELYDLLGYKAINSRYLSLVVSWPIDCSWRHYRLPSSFIGLSWGSWGWKPSSMVVEEGCTQRHHVGVTRSPILQHCPMSNGRVPLALDRLDCAAYMSCMTCWLIKPLILDIYHLWLVNWLIVVDNATQTLYPLDHWSVLVRLWILPVPDLLAELRVWGIRLVA